MSTLERVFSYLTSAAFFEGAMTTLMLTLGALLFGALVGLGLALLQESRLKGARFAVGVYLWLFRGTPVLFQIIFVYNVLPSFGIRLSGITSALVALSLNEGAYMSEILRSGLQAVKRGQRIAGLALGMTGVQVLTYVVIPQAARVVLPPIGNQMIGMLKLTALVSAIAVQELLLVANQTASADFRYLEALSAAGIYYLGLTTIFMGLLVLMERWLDPKARRRRVSITERLFGSPALALR